MKKLIVLMWCIYSLTGCQQNDPMQYEGEASVYFQLNKEWLKDADSVTYSFVNKGLDIDTLWLQVDLQGHAVNEDRAFGLKVNEKQTTAKEGLHYEQLKSEYILPAEAYRCQLPVVLYKKDPLLDQSSCLLVLELTATADLKPGITKRTRVKIRITNQLSRPVYWDEVVVSEFGSYSRVKHEHCIRELKTDFPATAEEYADDRSRWSAYGKHMSMYFEEHYPLPDENGVAIEPW